MKILVRIFFLLLAGWSVSLVESNCFAEEKYFDLFRDKSITHHVRVEKNPFLRPSLTLASSNLRLVYRIANEKDDTFLNLSHETGRGGERFLESFSAYPTKLIHANSTSRDISGEIIMHNALKELLEKGRKKEPANLSYRKTVRPSREFGAVFLMQNEFFVKSVYVSEIKIWREFAETVKKHRDDTYQLSSPCFVLKNEGEFYIVSAKLEIGYPDIRKIENATSTHANRVAQTKTGREMEPPKQYECSVSVDDSTGDLSVSITAYGNEYVRLDLDEVFGRTKIDFAGRFSLFDKNTPEPADSSSITDDTATPVENLQKRIIELDDHETLGKVTKIWELPCWEEMLTMPAKNINEKIFLSYPVSFVIGNKKIEDRAIIALDRKTFARVKALSVAK